MKNKTVTRGNRQFKVAYDGNMGERLASKEDIGLIILDVIYPIQMATNFAKEFVKKGFRYRF